METPIRNFFLASFSEEELEAFIAEKQEAKAKALAKMYNTVAKKKSHSKTFHRIVSGVKSLGFNKSIKQSLVSDWLEEALV